MVMVGDKESWGVRRDETDASGVMLSRAESEAGGVNSVITGVGQTIFCSILDSTR